jgi:hypothetical protein
MKRLLVAGALALALPACVATPRLAPTVLLAEADQKLAWAEAGYAAAKPLVAIARRYLPQDQRDRLDRAIAVVERALVTARTAVDAADRLAAARAAADAVAQFRFATGS